MHLGSSSLPESIFEILTPIFSETLDSEGTPPYSEPFDIVFSVSSEMSLRQFLSSVLQF